MSIARASLVGLVGLAELACTGANDGGTSSGNTSDGETTQGSTSSGSSSGSETSGGCEGQAAVCEAGLQTTQECFESHQCGMQPQCEYAICQADCVESFAQGLDACWRDCDPAQADEATCTAVCAAQWRECATMDPCDLVALDGCTAAYSKCGLACEG